MIAGRRSAERRVPGAPGRVILLNGASSSGKSSIAVEVQRQMPEPFWHISIDHLRDAGVLPSARIASGEFPWAGLRDRFFAGFEQSLRAYAGAGNDLIVEYITETPAWARRVLELLAGFDLFSVGVFCPHDVLEQRERARGDRPIGDARRDFDIVHRGREYDCEVDSRDLPERNAAAIIAAWERRVSR